MEGGFASTGRGGGQAGGRGGGGGGNAPGKQYLDAGNRKDIGTVGGNDKMTEGTLSSGGLGPGAAAAGPSDPVERTMLTFFSNLATVLQAELEGASNEYKLLEKMNLRAAEEYKNYGDFASGLRIFLERLGEKNQLFSEYLGQIDEIDTQVTELEAVVSTLDKHTSDLYSKLANMK